jgi:hypothetical protein
LEKVFVAQKRVVRAMAGVQYWRSNCALDSCLPLFRKYEILTVYSVYILECMKYLKKHPEKFRKQFDVPKRNRPNTRNAHINCCENDLYVEIENHLNILNQKPVVMIARIFNNLPKEMKMLDDDKLFLTSVKALVLQHQFYSMNEFFVCKF